MPRKPRQRRDVEPGPRDKARLLAQQADRELKNSRTDEAQRLYEEALNLDPDSPDALAGYGYFLLRLGRPEEAEVAYLRALSVCPDHESAQIRLGLLYRLRNEPLRTLECFQKAAEAQPCSGHVQVHLADAYWNTHRTDEASACLNRALENDPRLEAEVLWRRARIHEKDGEFELAIREAKRSIQLAPKLIHPRITIAAAQTGLGRVQEAIETAMEAVRLNPGYLEHHIWLLFMLNYHSGFTPEMLYEEARRWEKECIVPVVRPSPPPVNDPDPERRLRIGYVSPDFRFHVVTRFIQPVLEHHDRTQVEVFAYYVHPRTDSTTGVVERLVDHWRHLPFCNGERLAERIREDGIDILVDLAGHTGHVLHAFALKPAPVQVSWIGMLNTTGLSAMDYLLGDAHMPALGTEHCFSETVFRLPRTAACWRPFNINIPVHQAPCRARGSITFGCFNNPNKITRDVVKLWSTILHLVPTSRLLLKYSALEQPHRQQVFRDWFTEDGIDPARIEFQGATADYLACYDEVDIALDPFPYNGGTTTLDALWMGVPVVTLAGRTAVQRCATSILMGAGLGDFVAWTPEQYVKIALYLANEMPAMPDLRLEIRAALRRSPWMDEVGITRDVEAAYRQMWRQWCRQQTRSEVVARAEEAVSP
jgi:predicted O-linked N-acetylglucosamine transferase (SPINDLY family)